MKKIFLLALSVAFLVCGCSANDTTQMVAESLPEEVEQSVVNESVLEEEAQTVTQEAVEETTKVEETIIVEETVIVEESATQIQETEAVEDSVPADMTAEDIMLLTEKGILATQELNAEDLLSYTNVEAMYCLGNGIPFNEAGNRGEIEALVNDPTANLGIVEYYALLENVDAYDAILLETEEVDELNLFIAGQVNITDSENINYTVEKAYKVKVSYDGIEEETYAEGDEPYLLVFYVNGRWELDLYIEAMREMYQALSDLEALMQMQE